MSQSEINDFIMDLVEHHPELTTEKFISEFKLTVGRDPTFAEKRTFQKSKDLKNSAKSLKESKTMMQSSSLPVSKDVLVNFGGKEFGGYKFDKPLGKGAFGEVWLTSRLNKKFAVKVVDNNNVTAMTEKYFAEDIRISCPFVMNYISSFRDSLAPQKLFIAMEYCPRGNLQMVFDSMVGLGLVFPLNNIMKIFIQMIIGLYAIHGNHIIHRDIKPENILLDADYNAKIGDLGLARTIDTSSQMATTKAGTPNYMAPEILAFGNISYNSKVDIFATGLLSFQLCVKKMPYSNIMDLAARNFSPFPKNQFPERFCRLIYAMIDPEADRRPSAQAILEDPFVQEYASQLYYKKDRLIDLFQSRINRVISPSMQSLLVTENAAGTAFSSPLPSTFPSSTSVGVRRPPDMDADVAEFIEATAEDHPTFTLVDFRREFADGIMRPATTAEQNYFRRLLREGFGSSSRSSSSSSSVDGSQSCNTTSTKVSKVAPTNLTLTQDAPRYTFMVKAKGDRYGFGKKNEDLDKVCNGFDDDDDDDTDCGNDGSAIVIYSSESELDHKTTSFDRKDVVAFGFGAYSGTAINSLFLNGFTSLVTLATVPSSVQSIGDYFLRYCSSLIAPPTIPSSVKWIGDSFLKYCTSLTTPPTIPNSVTKIGRNFLQGCSSLTAPPIISRSIASIDDNFLGGCTSLATPPTLPNSITSIGNNFLIGCESLSAPPTIPNSVTSIGRNFLVWCTSLATPPTISNSITSIGDSFLSDCTSLIKPPTIPRLVRSIGGCFLAGCTSLTETPTIPGSVISIKGSFLAKCSSLTTPPTIPNSVTSIGSYFLGECSSLATPPTIPSSVTRISDEFLTFCTSLTAPPIIPNSVTSIGESFLRGCSSLSVPPTIPRSVKSVGNLFLDRCTLLKK